VKLKDKVAIITGASKGIGRAIAEKYAAEGAAVVVASRSMDLLSAIADGIKAGGGRALALAVDVRNAGSVEDLVARTVAEWGRLDIMVNNAGISMAQPSETLSTADWERAVQTDLFGVFYGCQSAARRMIAQGDGGNIINVTSVYGLVAAPMRAAYCASKAAGNMLTKLLACEWADRKIRVNAIAPGYIRTELVQGVIDQGIMDVAAVERRTPQKRIGEVEDVVGLALFLASDDSAFMTGSVVTVDGGWTAYGYL